HVADRGNLDLVDLRRVERERSLDADAERLLADRERFPGAGTLALQHDALEDLDSLALALDDLEVDAHGVARLELRDSLAQLGALEAVDHVAHRERTPKGHGMLADVDHPGAALDLHDPSEEVRPRDETPEPRVAGRGAVVAEEQVPVRRNRPAA